MSSSRKNIDTHKKAVDFGCKQSTEHFSKLGRFLAVECFYRIRVLAVPPSKKMGGTRLKIFMSPKNFCGFRPIHEKTRLKLAHFLRGGGDSKYTNTVMKHYEPQCDEYDCFRVRFPTDSELLPYFTQSHSPQNKRRP